MNFPNACVEDGEEFPDGLPNIFEVVEDCEAPNGLVD